VTKKRARALGAYPLLVCAAFGVSGCSGVPEARAPIANPAPPSALDDRPCRAAEPVEKALCRAELAVADAKKAEDVRRERCSEDVKRRITEVIVQIDGLRVARVQAADPVAHDDPAREARLTRTVESLSASLDLCFGEQARGEQAPSETLSLRADIQGPR
jgi:hypothetical protein